LNVSFQLSTRFLAGAVVAAGVAALFLATASSPRSAAGFTLVRISPRVFVVKAGGPRLPLRLVLAGSPTFPVTARYVPQPGCTTASWRCYPGTHVFPHPTKTLVWHNALYCLGGRASNRRWNVFVTDAKGDRSNPLVMTMKTCS
jgi:hypothetical protein